MKAAFHTLGCKVNSYESQAILEQFQKAGYIIVEFSQAADVYIINTCSVTSMAEHKSRQMLHRVRKLNPNAVVVATGCYAQRVGEELLNDSAIDIVVGNNRKSEITEIVADFIAEKGGKNAVVGDLMKCRDYESQMITSLGENVRAYVKIQDGCDRFCSYCIIPYVRGRSRCRDKKEILNEIRTLAANGYKEIVLTGIDISMYQGMIELVEEIENIDGIERVRLGSLEAGIVTTEFIERFARCKKACPHFHLSLQSGSNATLKRMNRHYSAEEFAEKVEFIRKSFDICAITTDCIVGFAGETDEEFEESFEFVKKMAFTQTHVFKYSRREGTVADRMPDQVSEQVKNERSARMIEMADGLNRKFEESLLGMTRPVLIEEETCTLDGRRILIGFTPEYIKVGIETGEKECFINKVVNVLLEKFDETANGRVILGRKM